MRSLLLPVLHLQLDVSPLKVPLNMLPVTWFPPNPPPPPPANASRPSAGKCSAGLDVRPAVLAEEIALRRLGPKSDFTDDHLTLLKYAERSFVL